MEKNQPANAKNLGSVSGLRRSPGGGNGNSLQYSCLENSMDRGVWRATVKRVAKSRTRLSEHKQYRAGSILLPRTDLLVALALEHPSVPFL